MRITDWDDAYANSIHIEGVEAIFAGWAEKAPAFRARAQAEVVRTGEGERQFVDLYRPEGAVQGLTVIVHGGYWLACEGREFAHLAAGPLAAGQAVGMVTYTLTPEARIAQITAEVAVAIRVLAERVEGPIRLAGHSAGGHLVTRMLCEGVLPEAVAGRIAHVLSISGVHDLRPLLRTTMNETLRLDEGEAARESPALLRPREGARVSCVVGGEERPEFLRQTALLANIWRGMGADTAEIVLPGHNHFTVLEELEAADGALTRLLLA